jgi:hypothetical protein
LERVSEAVEPVDANRHVGWPGDCRDVAAAAVDKVRDRRGGARPVIGVDVGEGVAGKGPAGQDHRSLGATQEGKERVLPVQRHQDDAVGVAVSDVPLDSRSVAFGAQEDEGVVGLRKFLVDAANRAGEERLGEQSRFML